MRPISTFLELGLVLFCAPVTAQVEGLPTPVDSTSETGEQKTIEIVVDVGGSGKTLGGYGGSLSWDPSVLQFVSHSGGDAPFDAPIVNTGNVATGLLTYADASTLGAQGSVRLLDVTFDVLGEPPATSQLDLEFSSLFGAGDFEDLMPQLQVTDGSTCISDFAFDLRVTVPVNTIVVWSAVSGATGYDVIRGNLSELSVDATTVHLGTVLCLENDSLDTTTGTGSEPTNPDIQSPAPGEGFYYVVRFNDGIQNRTYGYLKDCVRERIVDASDCL